MNKSTASIQVEKVEKSVDTEGTGKVYLIGAGPGDPELLTIKALRCIKESDVALVDDLIGDQIKAIVEKECKEVIEVGKRAGRHKKTQVEINQLIYALAKSGKTVARVKGGDPFVFGRGGEEAEFLARKGIKFSVIPGVSSAIAAPALAGIPLNHRNFDPAIIFVTGREKEGGRRINWKEMARMNATIVILMGVSRLEENVKTLLKYGKDPDTPVAIIEKASTPEQRIIEGNLSNIIGIAKRENIKAPAIIVIGNVVSLRGILRNFIF
jgi:uroporphyrin-III C-methyltransferase